MTSFSSFVLFPKFVGVVDTDGVGVTEPPTLFLFLLPGPVLLILSELGLLGGESLTTGPIVFVVPEVTLLKWPVPKMGPWIIDGIGATVTDGGDGIGWLFLPPRFDVVTTPLFEADEPTVDTGNGGIGNGWLFDEPRFVFLVLSCFSVDCDLKFINSNKL